MNARTRHDMNASLSIQENEAVYNYCDIKIIG